MFSNSRMVYGGLKFQGHPVEGFPELEVGDMDFSPKIVVGVDFTEGSAGILYHAFQISGGCSSRVSAVHALDPLPVMDLEARLGGPPNRVRTTLIEDVQKSWRDFCASALGVRRVQNCGSDVNFPRPALGSEAHGAEHDHATWPEGEGISLAVEIDEPVNALLRHVEECRADLLVLGRRGSSPEEAGLGSVAAACIRQAPTSVMLVGGNPPAAFRRVVACIDLQDPDESIITWTAGIARQENAELHILYVFDGPWNQLHYRGPTLAATSDFRKQYRDGLERRLEHLCEPLMEEIGAVGPVFQIFDYGASCDGIIAFVKMIGADLVVIGRRPRRAFLDVFRRPTAKRVALETECSVLSVKTKVVEQVTGMGKPAVSIGHS